MFSRTTKANFYYLNIPCIFFLEGIFGSGEKIPRKATNRKLVRKVFISYVKGNLNKACEQHSSLVANWLLLPGDHGSNPSEGKKISFSFLSSDLMIAFYL